MNLNFGDIFFNPVLMCGFWGYLVAQLIKVAADCVQNRRITFRRMVGSGGMPSSHSATVVGAAVAAGMSYGFDSGVFGLAVILSTIVMYDAAGVRRAAGNHARAINDLMERLFDEGETDFEELKELLGHEPMEVFMGALLGLVIAIGCCLWIY